MSPNEMARKIIIAVATRLYGAEDPALEDLEGKSLEKIPEALDPEAAVSIAATALIQMLAFPAPGSEEGEDSRWND